MYQVQRACSIKKAAWSSLEGQAVCREVGQGRAHTGSASRPSSVSRQLPTPLHSPDSQRAGWGYSTPKEPEPRGHRAPHSQNLTRLGSAGAQLGPSWGVSDGLVQMGPLDSRKLMNRKWLGAQFHGGCRLAPCLCTTREVKAASALALATVALADLRSRASGVSWPMLGTAPCSWAGLFLLGGGGL